MFSEDFEKILLDHYPFERYICGKPILLPFDYEAAYVTELFIPTNEVIVNIDDQWQAHETKVPEKLFVKIEGNFGKVKIAYDDFASSVQDNNES